MIVGATLRVKTTELSKRRWTEILSMLTFRDADFQEVMAYDLRKGGTEVLMPRGVLDKLQGLEIVDRRSRPRARKLAYVKKLGGPGYEGQREALAAMIEHGQGQIVAPPGKGKTEIALAFAASCATPTLVVVHTKDLFDQWIARVQSSVPGAEIGRIQGSTHSVGHITIAMAQTMKNRIGAGDEYWQQWGCLIIDEAHHAAAETWEWLLNVCPAYYRFGFTATERRADGRHPLVRFYIGPVIYKMKFESQVPMFIQPVVTNFGKKEVVYRGPFDWTNMLGVLSVDHERADLVAKYVLADVEAGHSVLVLSRRIAHLEMIYEAMRACLPGSEDFTMLTGSQGQLRRRETVQGLRDGSLRCILATQLADEGLDVPRIDRVHLTFPGKHDGRIIQQIGRALRKTDDKVDAVIYDYCDKWVGVLLRQYDQRYRTYKALKLQIRKEIRDEKSGTKKNKGRVIRDLVALARHGSPARSRRETG